MVEPRHIWLFLLAIGCSGATPSKLPRTNVLRYGSSGMTGGVSYVVRLNGTVAYESMGNLGNRRIDSKLSQAELDKLSSELDANDCCSLRSDGRQGKPDEPRPSFSVRLGDLDCEVAMWGFELAESVEAKACFDALHRFGDAIAKKATLPE